MKRITIYYLPKQSRKIPGFKPYENLLNRLIKQTDDRLHSAFEVAFC